VETRATEQKSRFFGDPTPEINFSLCLALGLWLDKIFGLNRAIFDADSLDARFFKIQKYGKFNTQYFC